MTEEIRETLPLMDFDRELSLDELLGGINRKKLFDALSNLLGMPFCICTTKGDPVIGAREVSMGFRLPLRAEMEPVGYLETPTDLADKTRSAVTLIELLLHSGARYLMASTLHLHAVKDDYDKLQKKYVALMESENRYKDLAENLEQRVSEQVKTIEATQLQLYQAEKMASVGQLAAGVAHEINNPIGFIQSNLVTAQSYVNDFSELTKQVEAGTKVDNMQGFLKEKDMAFVLEDFQVLLTESIDGARRVSAIVKDLKGFSNIDRGEEEVVNVNEIIQSVCNISLPQINKNAELTLVLVTLPLTRCRPGHLGQVFLNILLNAAKAIKEKGKISVESLLKDDRIVVRISDTGSGISEENMKRMFDPFFTTADVGDGTGLGLTVCRDIVKAHGGEIEVESTPGKGTSFSIVLPIIS